MAEIGKMGRLFFVGALRLMGIVPSALIGAQAKLALWGARTTIMCLLAQP